MIHDIGLLISLQLYPEQLRQVCEQAKAGGNFSELERQIIGVDHQMLGMALAEQWKFPRTCQMAAGYHHNPQALPLDARLQVAIVYIADTISCKAGLGFPLTGRLQEIDPAELKALEIDPAFVEKTAANLPEMVKNAAASMA
jgi:HD-like signal output (HDOD) protein